MMQQNSFSAAAAAAAAAASGNPHILISDASSLYSVEELPDPRRRGQRMCRPLRWKNCRTSCSGRRCGARSDADSVRVGRCVGRTAGRAAVAAVEHAVTQTAYVSAAVLEELPDELQWPLRRPSTQSVGAVIVAVRQPHNVYINSKQGCRIGF